MLKVKENGSYTLGDMPMDTECIQDVSKMDTEVRLGKDSIDKESIDKDIPEKEKKHKYGEYNHVLLTDTEHDKLITDYGESETEEAITFLDEYIEMKGYKAKSHYLCIKKWVFDAVKKNNQNKPQSLAEKWGLA
jgi:hypothetical protein